MVASSYCTERRVVLELKVRIIWRCYIYIPGICAVTAELCGCSCCMLLQSCAACCAFLLWQDVSQYEDEMPRILLPNDIIMRPASAKRESGKYCGRSLPVPTRDCRLGHECWMPLNAADIAAVTGDVCEFILHREAGCAWVEGSDYLAMLYMRCCCKAVWLLLLWCMLLLQSCAACCAFLLWQVVPQYENKMPRSLLPPNIIIMRRASVKREPFSWFSKGKAPLRRTRVGCLARVLFLLVCVTAVPLCHRV